MARFDIYTSTEDPWVLLLDVQADFISSTLSTRIAIPLMQKEQLQHFMHRLHIPIETPQGIWYAATHLMSALPQSDFGKRIGTAEPHSHEITAAIDFLLQGF